MDDIQMTQMVFNAAITREALDFQASMSASLINGTIEKGMEMQENLSRIAGLAAEGIGTNINMTV